MAVHHLFLALGVFTLIGPQYVAAVHLYALLQDESASAMTHKENHTSSLESHRNPGQDKGLADLNGKEIPMHDIFHAHMKLFVGQKVIMTELTGPATFKIDDSLDWVKEWENLWKPEYKVIEADQKHWTAISLPHNYYSTSWTLKDMTLKEFFQELNIQLCGGAQHFPHKATARGADCKDSMWDVTYYNCQHYIRDLLHTLMIKKALSGKNPIEYYDNVLKINVDEFNILGWPRLTEFMSRLARYFSWVTRFGWDQVNEWQTFCNSHNELCDMKIKNVAIYWTRTRAGTLLTPEAERLANNEKRRADMLLSHISGPR